MDALVTAYSQWGTVDKTYPRTFSEQNLLDENRQFKRISFCNSTKRLYETIGVR